MEKRRNAIDNMRSKDQNKRSIASKEQNEQGVNENIKQKVKWAESK